MTLQTNKLTKKELQIYILLLCANADSAETEEELNMIKSKVDAETFERIYKDFSSATEDERLERVDDNIQVHDFENIELAELRREMYEIFFADCDFKIMERNLNRIMDNIIY
ncbi:hypothetical protein LX77_03438 [Gelidibacter algens]|jgi:hypothetical protein|uniref:Tellurite resistance protein TerB n=1 Tax=Gelidibacter algens TaxID=49280 RepID=A0A1A7QRY2_9FLAO|nr:hypothetical protein [Gelidibacter algens]OBX22083.1 hypothetical protein A9996_17350 [Gelidibacter algens]RAJ19695.1 hypothetical protein LX77_03438 [Gelidibacter algens]